jgi:hypothetical protein
VAYPLPDELDALIVPFSDLKPNSEAPRRRPGCCAMLVMASAFGLWRARLISNALFAVGVAAVVLLLLGGTTWLSGGFWAPDGAYSRFVSPIIGLAWALVVSGVLLTRSPNKRAGW